MSAADEIELMAIGYSFAFARGELYIGFGPLPITEDGYEVEVSQGDTVIWRGQFFGKVEPEVAKVFLLWIAGESSFVPAGFVLPGGHDPRGVPVL